MVDVSESAQKTRELTAAYDEMRRLQGRLLQRTRTQALGQLAAGTAHADTGADGIDLRVAAPDGDFGAETGFAGDALAAGPVAPNQPLPDRPDYRRLFHFNTIMVGNVLLDMGFNYNRPDGRVWFVEDLAKEGGAKEEEKFV